MIGDEYKKNVKKSTPKEERKKKETGERNYYASQIPKLRDMNKAISVSSIITLVFLALAYALVLLTFILSLNTDKPYSTVKFIVWSCVMGAYLVCIALWYLVLKPNNVKKIERYKAEIDRINAENLKKAAYSYKPQPKNDENR